VDDGARGWAGIDPQAYRQGWDAAAAGRPRWSCDFFGAGPRAAWEQGYDDFMAERAKEPSDG
jgi:ribosome modulation factor